MAASRLAWRARQRDLDPARLIFIDETWATTNMGRRTGRGRRGRRVVGAVPHGHWKTSTFVAGLRQTGVVAPFVIGRAINGLIFKTYVERVLTPELKPGDIVIMDNLGSHKSAAIRHTIEATGASLLFLPPYSPDLNPIEQAFAKLKSLLRSAAMRTVEGLWNTIGQSLDRFLPEECTNYISNSGYRQSA